MATEAQVRANRLNAKRSTGPRTAEGKAVVAQNAVKHGLSARQAVIVGEDMGEFEFYREQMLAELAPEGAMESALAQRAVGLAWRLRRAERLQNEAFDTLYEKDAAGPFARFLRKQDARERGTADDEAGGDPTCGRIVVRDFGNARVLDRLLLYERRLEHSLYKTLAELQRLRLLRLVELPVTEAEGDAAEPSLDRAKQSQFASGPAEAKCCARNDIDEEPASEPASEQSQTNPIVPTHGPEQDGVSESHRGSEPVSGGFQRAEPALYLASTQAGCDARHAASTATARDTVERESP